MSDSTNTATSTVHASTDRASSRRREEDDSDVEVDLEANPNEEAELAAMRARVAEMEAEAAKLRELTAASDAAAASSSSSTAPSARPAATGDKDGDSFMSEEDKEVDSRSVYVGNVDYASTPEEIQAYFASCGTINRVTILFDKFTGPKGYAYVEFADPSIVDNAVKLDGTTFRGRLLKVTPKRTNIPGYNAPRGRGRGRGRGGYRGGYNAGGHHFSPYSRGGRGRGRGRGGPPMY